jgi:hypothetical protein
VTKYIFQLIEQDNFASITVFHDGEILFATRASHDNYDSIVDRVVAGDPDAIDLFDLRRAIKRYSDQSLSGRVRVEGGVVLLDDEPADNAITDLILRFIDEGLDAGPLARFLEKVNENPNAHSREQLFRWLNTHRFAITPSGDIVGYKGVRTDFGSITAGPGIVNGTPCDGNLDNSPGNVLEMERREVDFDPTRGCSTGLHVGTWSYARSFASQGKVVELHVNPADVVSVPTDCSDAKMRVARYKVVRELSEPYDKTLVLG